MLLESYPDADLRPRGVEDGFAVLAVAFAAFFAAFFAVLTGLASAFVPAAVVFFAADLEVVAVALVVVLPAVPAGFDLVVVALVAVANGPPIRAARHPSRSRRGRARRSARTTSILPEEQPRDREVRHEIRSSTCGFPVVALRSHDDSDGPNGPFPKHLFGTLSHLLGERARLGPPGAVLRANGEDAPLQ